MRKEKMGKEKMIKSKRILALVLSAALTLSGSSVAWAESDISLITTDESEEIILDDTLVDESEEIVLDDTLVDESEEITESDADLTGIEEIDCADEMVTGSAEDDEAARNADMNKDHISKEPKLYSYLCNQYPQLKVDGVLNEDTLKSNTASNCSRIEIKRENEPDIVKNMVNLNFLGLIGGVDTLVIDGMDEIRKLSLPPNLKHLIIKNSTLNLRTDATIFGGWGGYDCGLKDVELETLILDNVTIGNRFEYDHTYDNQREYWTYAANNVFDISQFDGLKEFRANVYFKSSGSSVSFKAGDEVFPQLTKEKFEVNRIGNYGRIAVSSSNSESFFNKNYETVNDPLEDDYFRNVLIKRFYADTNSDGFLSQGELDQITSLDLNSNSIGSTYIDVLHNFNDLQHLRYLKNLTIDLDNRNAVYIKSIKFPNTGHLKSISITNCPTKCEEIEIPSVETFTYSNNTGDKKPTITINDSKGEVSAINMVDANPGKLIINNTSTQAGKINMDIYNCTALEAVEFTGAGYKLKGDACFELCSDLKYIGQEQSEGVWQIDGEFEEGTAAFKVSDCYNLCNDINQLILNYNFTSNETLSVFAYNLTVLNNSNVQSFEIITNNETQGTVKVYEEREHYFSKKYISNSKFKFDSAPDTPTIAVFDLAGNEILKKRDEAGNWVRRWPIVYLTQDRICNFFSTLSFYAEYKDEEMAGQKGAVGILRLNYSGSRYFVIDDENVVYRDSDHLVSKNPGRTSVKVYLSEEAYNANPDNYIGRADVFIRNRATDIELVDNNVNLGKGTEADPICIAKDGTLSFSATTKYEAHDYLPLREDGSCSDEVYWMFGERNREGNWEDMVPSITSSSGISVADNKWNGETNTRAFKLSNTGKYRLAAQAPANKKDVVRAIMIRKELFVEVVEPADYEISSREIIHGRADRNSTDVTITKYRRADVTIKDSDKYGNYFEIVTDDASTDEKLVKRLKVKDNLSVEDNKALQKLIEENGTITILISADGLVHEEIINLKSEYIEPFNDSDWVDIDDGDRDEIDLNLVTETSITVAGIKDVTYTGSPVKFDVRVYYGKNLLNEGTDYTLTYKNNKNVSTSDTPDDKRPCVIIKGKGVYAANKGSKGFENQTKTFAINPIDITTAVVSNESALSAVDSKGNPKALKPVPTVMLNGKKLKYKTDYGIMYNAAYADGFTEVGKYAIKVVGKGNYSGEVISTFTLADKDSANLISKATVCDMKTSAVYSGAELKLADLAKKSGEDVKVNIKLTGEKTAAMLTEGVDYTVSYRDNVQIGTATVIFSAMEGNDKNLVGEKRVNFKIAGSALSKTKVELKLNESDSRATTSYSYTGKQIKPLVIINTKGANPVRLEQGKDYTVEYQKNISVGTATVILKGIGTYTGTLKKTFKIKAVDLSKATEDELIAEVDNSSIVKNEKGCYEPDVRVVYNGKLLTEGKDYTLSYKNNKKAGLSTDGKSAPTVIIKGIRNYAKTKSLTFDIV